MTYYLYSLIALFLYHVNADVPLTEWSFLMSHDSASGILSSGVIHPINRYTKTQEGNIYDQLKCGARAFDLRPLVQGDDLIMHHGDVALDYKFSDAIDHIIEWDAEFEKSNGTLIIGFVTRCQGDGCMDKVKDVLATRNLQFEDDCGVVRESSYEQMRKIHELPAGGGLLLTSDCIESNWNSTIACYGRNSGYAKWDEAKHKYPDIPRNELPKAVANPAAFGLYSCTGSSSSYPISELENYYKNVTAKQYRQGMWMTQAHWQLTTASIAMGEAQFSSILKDESNSKVNANLQTLIPTFEELNLLEVDNVCDYGKEIDEVLSKRNGETRLRWRNWTP